MADWTTPSLITGYSNFLSFLKERDEDLAKMFDGVGTNLVVDTIRWSSSGNKFEKWDGGAFNDLSSAYDINVLKLNGQAASYYLNCVNFTGLLPGASFDNNSHSNRGGGSLHAVATTDTAGFISGANQLKLNGIEANAKDDQTGDEMAAALAGKIFSLGGHGTPAIGQPVNIIYGTGETPPAASGHTEGTIYLQYTP